ncbi:MAG: hypothetical protein II931_05745 [Clostridia bacterium]|nr:hypothetical protein [Clostridia bacterium]
MKIISKILLQLFVVALLCNFMLCAFADELPKGSVEGLPEKLVVLDDNGQSVSDNGDYFFLVEDMEPNVTYTKNIQIMNLREDKSYRITFSAQPLSRSGEIDLENECECVISLDGSQIYSGKVTGEGTPDIRETPLDLGVYTPSRFRRMSVSVKWNGTSVGGFIDNGQRVVTNSGTEITRSMSGKTTIYGETEFKFIFRAEVTDSDVSEPTSDNSVTSSDSSKTVTTSETTSRTTISDFVKTGEVVAIFTLFIVMTATLTLIVLLIRKKNDKKTS